MCGRVRIKRGHEWEAKLHGLIPDFEEFSEIRIGLYSQPRYNVAPSQFVPIVRREEDDKAVLAEAKWGLIPSWTRGKPKMAPINARCETAATSGMFRQALDRRRCLIPADGFYEWKRLDEKNKQPYFIHRKDDDVFCFAGLWERWKPDPDAEPVDTFTILTTTPNRLMAEIHDRMPVILEEKDYPLWLDRSVPGSGVAHLLKQYPPELLEAYKVSKYVNSPKNDGPECSERVE